MQNLINILKPKLNNVNTSENNLNFHSPLVFENASIVIPDIAGLHESRQGGTRIWSGPESLSESHSIKPINCSNTAVIDNQPQTVSNMPRNARSDDAGVYADSGPDIRANAGVGKYPARSGSNPERPEASTHGD